MVQRIVPIFVALLGVVTEYAKERFGLWGDALRPFYSTGFQTSHISWNNMKIDSLQFAMYVQAILQDAEKGDQLAMQTLTEWDEMNQEEGLPPMKEQLTEWNKANAPQRSTTDVQPLTQPTTMAKTFEEETNERCEQWERERPKPQEPITRGMDNGNGVDSMLSTL